MNNMCIHNVTDVKINKEIYNGFSTMELLVSSKDHSNNPQVFEITLFSGDDKPFNFNLKRYQRSKT
tara:strand:- start:213 stop:410 length:198 start_codon:yes stop_codon:yes gene_type:complete